MKDKIDTLMQLLDGFSEEDREKIITILQIIMELSQLPSLSA